MALNFFKKKKQIDTDPEPGVKSTLPGQEPPLPDPEPGPEPETAPPEISSGDENIAPEKPAGFFRRLKTGLSKTRKSLSGGLEKIFIGKGTVDDDLLESLEELLITSDVGVQTTMTLIDRVSDNANRIGNSDQLKEVLKEEVLSFFDPLEEVQPQT